MNTNNKHINLNFYKNFVYFSVKKTLKTLLMIILYFSLTNTSIACEFLKEKIGTPVSNIIEKYDDLDEPPSGGDPTSTYVKEYNSLSLCENSKLENIKGNEPNIAILNQANAVRRNACCKLSFFS